MEHVNELSDALPANNDGILYIEACQHQSSDIPRADIKKHVFEYVAAVTLKWGDCITVFPGNKFLTDHVKSISVPDNDGLDSCSSIDKSKYTCTIHVYQLFTEGAASEEIEEDELSAASHWILPAAEFEGIWENLIFDSDVKKHLLSYAATTLLFSDRGVDSNVISWNRVVLLHGPAGTGKTSLCKALSQKLAIRMSDRFRYGQLIEINSHSLFSKWFSESGKLVQKMFQRIQELIDDPQSLVCVLIDEVESLTAARTAAMKGTEPSDAIRVVNALLTQIDNIKRYPNVLILTTSNITGAIDLAFVDRADIKQYIGPPSVHAIFTIYHSCVTELKNRQIITRANLPTLRTLKMMRFQENEANSISFRVLEVARKSYGLSGRTLRKLPFLAHALYLQSSNCVTQEVFINALSKAVDKQLEDRDKLSGEIEKQFTQRPYTDKNCSAGEEEAPPKPINGH